MRPQRRGVFAAGWRKMPPLPTHTLKGDPCPRPTRSPSCRRRHWQRSHARRPARHHGRRQRFGLAFAAAPTLNGASCDYYAEHGKMMPTTGRLTASGMDAICSALWAGRHRATTTSRCGVRCSSSAASSTSTSTCAPCACLKACPAPGRPQARRHRHYVVRENTEGEYTLGGVMYEGTDRESSSRNRSTRATARTACSSSLSTWPPPTARTRHPAPRATASPSACPGGTNAPTSRQGLPNVTLDKQHIDILTARFVLQPRPL